MSDPESLHDVLAPAERERQEADRLYNDALTAVDRALQQAPPTVPAPPVAYDEQLLPRLNESWDLLPDGAPAADRSLKGRLRGLIWRLVGPALERQRGFNAALVDHLNRNVAAHRDAARVTAELVSLVADQLRHAVAFEQRLILYFQTITLYVDTKDRASMGHAKVQNAMLSALSDDWLKRWETLSLREARYADRNAALTKAYDDLRETVAIAQQTSLALKRELQRLVAEDSGPKTEGPGPRAEGPTSAPSRHSDLDALVYVGFEDRFRGTRDEIRARLVDYLPIFADASNVLDIGCGRGELLDLFRQHGIVAHGIDVNAEMVEACRERGLVAEVDDAVGYLEAQPEESLGGLIAIQVVEHLEPAYLTRLLDAARRALRQGAPMVLETINPSCWVAFFESYIRDLSHVRPLHPDTLRYLVQAHGFSSIDVEYRAPVPEADRLQHVRLPAPAPGSEHDPMLVEVVDAVNGHADKINARLFTFMDYAVVARR